MSEVIRDAIVRLGIQISTPNLKLPDIASVVKQQQALADATRNGDNANRAAAESSAKLAEVQASRLQPITDLQVAMTRLMSANERAAEIDADMEARLKSGNYVMQETLAYKVAAAEESERLAQANLKVNAAYGKVAIAAAGVARGIGFLAVGQHGALEKRSHCFLH
jgi:hypothetical protein